MFVHRWRDGAKWLTSQGGFVEPLETPLDPQLGKYLCDQTEIPTWKMLIWNQPGLFQTSCKSLGDGLFIF